ncbi:MAG: transketolase family protein [Candidatus Delongbacteria bacterium]|nr:transketolase family protein [Candidatus Delongbacteria bacterium]
MATRFGYSEALIRLLDQNKDILVLDADLAKSTTTSLVQDRYPDHFVDVGIAEQNLVGIAAGISLNGTTPFISTYAAFLAGRAFDQIRTTVCYSNLNVKFAGMHTGITVGEDGPTHQMLEDIALMRVLPNMTILNPCDYNEAVKATLAADNLKGPVYIRFVRESTEVFTKKNDRFVVGEANELLKGKDLTFISSGPILYKALQAAEELINEGYSIRVLNFHTIKPLDNDAIIKAAMETKGILVIDEHQIYGGLGTAVSEVIAMNNLDVLYKLIAVEDRFLTSGKPEELLNMTGFTKENIKRIAKEMITQKKSGT